MCMLQYLPAMAAVPTWVFDATTATAMGNIPGVGTTSISSSISKGMFCNVINILKNFKLQLVAVRLRGGLRPNFNGDPKKAKSGFSIIFNAEYKIWIFPIPLAGVGVGWWYDHCLFDIRPNPTPPPVCYFTHRSTPCFGTRTKIILVN